MTFESTCPELCVKQDNPLIASKEVRDHAPSIRTSVVGVIECAEWSSPRLVVGRREAHWSLTGEGGARGGAKC
ncbi:hypothetical protein RRG08_042549 [Elysia crispata]|uniref:Uncharacterized protein n=1 Tax=Elysia crispata TaxID=231223 RepID=A0AAE0XPX9_9GAST|nr:hypothetical protein RRG08_042549 [Elysia crispata]